MDGRWTCHLASVFEVDQVAGPFVWCGLSADAEPDPGQRAAMVTAATVAGDGLQR